MCSLDCKTLDRRFQTKFEGQVYAQLAGPPPAEPLWNMIPQLSMAPTIHALICFALSKQQWVTVCFSQRQQRPNQAALAEATAEVESPWRDRESSDATTTVAAHPDLRHSWPQPTQSDFEKDDAELHT